MTQIARDFRYGFRTLSKSPAFTAVCVAVLSLGIGVNSLLFTFFNAYVLRPLPFEDPDRNVEIRGRGLDGRFLGFWSYPDFLRISKQNSVLESVYGYAHFEARLPETGQSLKGVAVTGNLFSLLRANMALGRPFTEDGDAALVLSHSAWRRLFHEDPSIVGKAIRIRQREFRIAAVVAPSFTGLDPVTPDCWAPLSLFEQLAPERGRLADPETAWVMMGGILRRGVSAPQAAHALTAVAAAANGGVSRQAAIRNVELTPRRAFVTLVPSVLAVALLIAAAFAMVLLIACANLAGLMLARAAAREREIAIRLAIGASRARIVRQLLAESVLLSMIAAVPALGLTWLGIGPVQRLLFSVLTRQGFTVQPISPDWRVFVFTFVVAAAAGILFGLTPGIQAASRPLAERLKHQGAVAGLRARPMREALVIAQIATSLTLLVAAAFFVRSAQRVNRLQAGFDVERALDVRPDAPRQRLLALIRNDPHFLSVSEVYRTPLYGSVTRVMATADGRAWTLAYNYVDQRYFATLGIPLRAGRSFSGDDASPGARAAMVSEATARLLWPGETALGKTIRVAAESADKRIAARTYEVVGIAADVISSDISTGPDRTALYLPAIPGDARNSGLIVRTAADARSTAPYLQKLCASLGPESSCRPVALSELEDLQRSPYAIASGVASALGLAALGLTCLGLYSVVAFSVAQRRREIGIRMALGATRAGVLALVLRDCGRRLGWGLLLGMPVCFGLAKAANASFLTLDTHDPAAFAAAPAILVVTALLACYLPARRAATADPLIALKHD